MGWVRSSRNELRKLRRQIGCVVVKIPLEDGTTFQCSADEIGVMMFSHFADTLRALHYREPRPAPPELIQAIASAKDRPKALRDAFPPDGGPPFLTVDEEALRERGELVAKPLATHELEG